ncbi:MAG: thiol-disulfide oxidoreductase DCC family protein [Myxococcaceae bacterium]
MQALYVLYDDSCGFCCRCAEWIRRQRSFVELICWPTDSPRTRGAFPDLRRTAEKQELICISDRGEVFRGSAAWLMVLWALKDYRGWARRLSSPALRPLARNLFEFVSTNRHKVSQWFGMQPEQYIAASLRDRYGDPEVPKCAGDACDVKIAALLR